MQLGELEAQPGVQLTQRSAPRIRPRLITILGQQRAAVKTERPLIRGRVTIGSSPRRSRLKPINVNPSRKNNRAVHERHGGRAISARAVERTARGIEGLVEVIRGCVSVSVGPQHLSETLAMHAPIGRQREDLHQRLGLTQSPRAIGDHAVADGDRETAQQADTRLAAVCSWLAPSQRA